MLTLSQRLGLQYISPRPGTFWW